MDCNVAKTASLENPILHASCTTEGSKALASVAVVVPVGLVEVLPVVPLLLPVEPAPGPPLLFCKPDDRFVNSVSSSFYEIEAVDVLAKCRNA